MSLKSPLIQFENVTYTYMQGTPMECTAIKDVSLSVYPGECIGIVGATGSGKSTLVQHFNGLLRGQTGTAQICGIKVTPSSSGKEMACIRFASGILFQFPEQQLFEETLFDDIAFGPRNMGLDEKEVEERVIESINQVGLGHKDYRRISPLLMSGGEKRRAALAGVLSMRPQCLILDEPTAGLDPKGASEILNMLKELQKERGLTMIMVSHRFNELVKLCSRMVIMNSGKITYDGPVKEALYSEKILAEAGLLAPDICCLFSDLCRRGVKFDDMPVTPESAAEVIKCMLQSRAAVS